MEYIGCDAELRPYLQDGETLLWAGKPGTGLRLRPSDTLMIPFSLIWCGFVIFWEAGVLRSGNVIFALWGIPFIAVGLHMVAGRFVWDALVRASQAYGVTSNRLLVKSDFPRTSIKSFDLANLPSLTLAEQADSSGSIKFERDSEESSPSTSTFEFISNARHVYDTIVAAQKALQRPVAIR